MKRDLRSPRELSTRSEMRTMGPSLCLMLFLLPASASGVGECFFNAKATCEHGGVRLEIGDTWVNDQCYQCVCLDPFGVGCCDNAQQPVDYPDWCELVRRSESCELELVMKADPRVPCIGQSTPKHLHLGRARQEKGHWF
ncbi:prostate-associated microseminoprotein-like [Mobula hypostoma]|uniref:prostate-associated microseminoprotein-like n=1 Tax=Mobula hypostoma TaxID=723540 RepID=UPI002FC3B821